jgi:hypothetical protein
MVQNVYIGDYKFTSISKINSMVGIRRTTITYESGSLWIEINNYLAR